MKTIFIPGYSIRNRNWQNDVIKALPELEFLPISFQHWQSGIDDITTFDYADELTRLRILALANQPVNILAKSIGTILALQLILEKSVIVSNIILCGVPIKSLPASVDLLKQLAELPNLKLLVVQNSTDPVGSADEVFGITKKFLPNTKCVATNRDDHHYPFPEIFSDHLESK